MRALARLTRPQWPRLGLACVLASLASLLDVAPYWLVYRLAQAVLEDALTPRLASLLVGGLLAVSVARLLLFGLANVVSHAAAFRWQRQTRERLLRQLSRIPLNHRLDDDGQLRKILIDNVARLENVIGHALPDAVAGLALLLAAAGVLFAVDWPMALAALGTAPLAVWAHRRSFRGLDSILAQWHQADSRATGAVLSYVRGIVTLRAHNRTASSLRHLHEATHALARLATRVTRQTALPYATLFVALSGNLFLLLPTGLLRMANGTLDLATFLFFMALGWSLTAPLLRLLSLYGTLRRELVGAQQILDVLALAPPASGALPMPPAGPLQLHGVDAGPAGRPHLLRSLSATFPPCALTAVIGPSGAGKTTLLNLLLRRWTPTAGTLSLAGTPWAQICQRDLYQHVAHVPQTPHLVAGTLRENLCLSAPQATPAELQRVVVDCALTALVARLPQGLDTPLAEYGQTLSGGERQKICLARALLKPAWLLLLDEPTAAVDAVSAAHIHRALRLAARARTVIVVTHHLTLAAQADQILLLEAGHLTAHGTHATLRQTCARYQAMWNAWQRAQHWAPRTAPDGAEAVPTPSEKALRHDAPHA